MRAIACFIVSTGALQDPNMYKACEPLKGCTDESREKDYKEARSLINPFSHIKDKTSSATPQDNSYPRPPAP